MDDSEVGVGARRFWILRQHSAKRPLCQIEVIILQSGFALLK